MKMSSLALLPPANEVCEGYVFTPVCQSFCSGGACVAGGMHGRGACVAGGHALAGERAWHVGGMWVGGYVWQGGMHATHAPLDITRYGRSMRGRYASYWNAFLLSNVTSKLCCKMNKTIVLSKRCLTMHV